MLQKKKETLDFFHEMEQNIKNKIQKAQELEEKYRGDPDVMYELSSSPSDLLFYREDSKDGTSGRDRLNSAGSNEGKLSGSYEGGRGRLNSYVSTRRVRTISTMDGTYSRISIFSEDEFWLSLLFLTDEVLMLMRQSSGEERRNSYSRRMQPLVAEEKSSYSSRAQAKESLLAQAKADSKAYDTLDATRSSKKSGKKQPKRRNSTGTIYIENTMATQDNTATIECVCVVIRAHMITAARENIVPLPEYDVFKDIGFSNSTNREQKEVNPVASVRTFSC